MQQHRQIDQVHAHLAAVFHLLTLRKKMKKFICSLEIHVHVVLVHLRRESENFFVTELYNTKSNTIQSNTRCQFAIKQH